MPAHLSLFNPVGTCPSGWRLYNRRCYKFSAQKKSWDDAFAFCKKQNARLFEAETVEGYDFLRSAHADEILYTKGTEAVWLGFKREYLAGIYHST